MTIHTSGPINFTHIQTEFGGSHPLNLSSGYATSIGKTVGATINVGDFYGKSSGIPYSIPFVSDTYTFGLYGDIYGVVSSGHINNHFGSWPDGTVTAPSGAAAGFRSTPIMFPDGFKYGCGGFTTYQSVYTFILRLSRDGVTTGSTSWTPFNTVTLKNAGTNATIIGPHNRTAAQNVSVDGDSVVWYWNIPTTVVLTDGTTYRIEFT